MSGAIEGGGEMEETVEDGQSMEEQNEGGSQYYM